MRNPFAADKPKYLNIHIDTHITGGPVIDYDVEIPIPEGYDAADVRALIARELEDGAFAMNRREFGRAPTRDALRAAAARLRALRAAIDGPDGIIPLRTRLLLLFALSNREVTDAWAEDPE